MGSEPPVIPPVILDGKYYAVYVDVFDSTYPDSPGCDNAYLLTTCCCLEGWIIKEKIKNGNECKHFYSICFGNNAQRIMLIDGPFDSEYDCWLAHGCPF